MKATLLAVMCCLLLAATLSYAQGGDEGYQMARIVSIERVAANAQHMEKSDNYKIFMRLGDIVYKCTGSGSAATFIDWHDNKEFPAKLNGKILLVKSPSGEVVELNVVGKKTPK